MPNAEYWPSSSVLLSCIQHAQQSYPYEACGAWSLSPNGICLHHPLSNIAPISSRTHNFQFDSLEWLNLLKEEDDKLFQLKGIYHSHPDASANFSRRDQQQLTLDGQPSYPGLFQLVIGLKSRSTPTCGLYDWSTQTAQFEPIEFFSASEQKALHTA